ncbi:amidohydrolase family protein [Streptomyces sp. NPDC026665]|uniref:amidohydrolase family protein n=1 Tax=Streptomyces sp. NPDC026665 TaxID=3154798 RepID=UPI0033EF676A
MSRNRIDVHTHYMGGTVARLMENVTFPGGFRIAPWTVDGALRFMDDHEIAAQVLSFPSALAGEPRPGLAAGLAVGLARNINEELAEIVRARPDRFGAFASLPLDAPDDALKEITYALDELGLDGVTLPSNAKGEYFGEPFFEPVLAELARRRTPVFVHPENCPHIDVLGMGRVGSIVEFPLDTTRNIVNAVYRGVFKRHPGLTLILAHGGGALPALGWRIAAHSGLGRAPQDAAIDAGHIADVLRGLYYETALAGSRNSLLPTLEVTDVDHVLFGTDWPAAPVPVIDDNTGNLTKFDGFTPEELTAVERGNATRLFPRFA